MYSEVFSSLDDASFYDTTLVVTLYLRSSQVFEMGKGTID